MKSFKALVLVSALSVLAFAASNASAAIIWSADCTPGTATVISDSGSNSIDFKNLAAQSYSGSSDIVGTNLTLHTPFTGSADTWTHQNYSIKMLLTDVASGQSITKVFSGDLTGTVTGGSNPNSNIVNEFDPAHTSYEFDLGNDHYKVTVTGYTPVPPLGSSTAGGIGIHVDVRANGGQEPPPPNETPEPSTMLLSVLGLAGMGMGAWKKYKARA
jgi:hypothetical protein